MSLKPTTKGSSGGTPHKREQTKSQQTSTAVRPPLPRDGSMNGINTTLTGKMPAGFVAVFNFDGNTNTKKSGTTKPGNCSGKDIC